MLALVGSSCIGAAHRRWSLYAVLSQVDEEAVVRSSLRQLDGYEVENVRDQELLDPLSERAVTPVLAGLTDARPAVHAASATSTTSARSSSSPGAAGTDDGRPLPRRPRAHRSR